MGFLNRYLRNNSVSNFNGYDKKDLYLKKFLLIDPEFYNNATIYVIAYNLLYYNHFSINIFKDKKYPNSYIENIFKNNKNLIIKFIRYMVIRNILNLIYNGHFSLPINKVKSKRIDSIYAKLVNKGTNASYLNYSKEVTDLDIELFLANRQIHNCKDYSSTIEDDIFMIKVFGKFIKDIRNIENVINEESKFISFINILKCLIYFNNQDIERSYQSKLENKMDSYYNLDKILFMISYFDIDKLYLITNIYNN